MAVGPPDLFIEQQPAVQCLDGGLEAAMQWSGDMLVLAFYGDSFTSAGAVLELVQMVLMTRNTIEFACMEKRSAAAQLMTCSVHLRVASCSGDALQLSDAAKACISDEGIRQAVSEFTQCNDFKGAQVHQSTTPPGKASRPATAYEHVDSLAPVDGGSQLQTPSMGSP